MSLFGNNRDVSLLRHINRELMGNIITQQCVYYKYDINKTQTNIYGENVNNKFFHSPVIFNVLIERNDQQQPVNDFGVNFKRNLNFAFLRDDLVEANLVPEIGDVILYQEAYYEIDELISNQLFVGKDPQYPNDPNPLNPGLENFGWNVSIIVKTHYEPGDKFNLSKIRL